MANSHRERVTNTSTIRFLPATDVIHSLEVNKSFVFGVSKILNVSEIWHFADIYPDGVTEALCQKQFMKTIFGNVPGRSTRCKQIAKSEWIYDQYW